ncbi:MAG: tetratricopeptide repeat protein, partial [Candidatus Aminicenantes bacterium]|nr:tetratricopeptide repeat protein [Candidatus Aminicenantes bacterium]
SLVAWLKGKIRKDLDCLVESFYPRENFGWSDLVGLISARWKFIQSPRPELYDLEQDPEEHRNLYELSPGRAGELKKKLEEEVLNASSGGEREGSETGVRAEDMERLRSLGYVNLAPAKPGSTFPDPKDKIDLLRLIQQAQAYELEERYAEAEQAYLEVLEEIPDSPAGYVNLAIAQALQKKFDRAIETLNRGITKIPDSEILMVRLGHTHLVTGRSRDAFEAMEKVLKLNPRNVDALTVSAGILDSEGRKEEARTYYERALVIEPESRHLRMRYAGNLASGGRLREAIEIYEQLIGDFPEEQGFYQYIGIAYSYLGEDEQAIAWLERALAVRPTPTGHFNLAVAYEKRGNVEEAAKHFKMYLENPQGESEADIRKAKAELERLAKGR